MSDRQFIIVATGQDDVESLNTSSTASQRRKTLTLENKRNDKTSSKT